MANNRHERTDKPRIPYHEREELEDFTIEIDGKKVRVFKAKPKENLPENSYESRGWGCSRRKCKVRWSSLTSALGEYPRHNLNEHGGKLENGVVKIYTLKGN